MPGKKLLLLPLTFTALLAALAFSTPVRSNPRLLWAFVGVALILVAWNALLASMLREGRKLAVEVVLKKQHYMQALGQGIILLYWGWHWPKVYEFAPFIVAQLLFAYAFDILFCWS